MRRGALWITLLGVCNIMVLAKEPKTELFFTSYEHISAEKIKKGDTKLGVEKYTLKATLPTLFKQSHYQTVLMHTLHYDRMHFYTEPESKSAFDDFQSLVYSVRVIPPKLTENTTLIMNVGYGFHSDFSGFRKSDTRLEGASVLSIKGDENRRYTLGVGYSSQFGEPAPIPIMSISQSLNTWRWSVGFPSGVRVVYDVTEKVSVGSYVLFTGGHYRINHEKTADAHLNYTAVKAGVGGEYHLYKNWHIQGRVGSTLSQRVEVKEGSQKRLSLETDSGLFIDAVLRYRF